MKKCIYSVLLTLFLFSVALAEPPPCTVDCDNVTIELEQAQGFDFIQETDLESPFLIKENNDISINYTIYIVAIDQDILLLCIPVEANNDIRHLPTLKLPEQTYVGDISYPLAFKLNGKST